MLATIGLAGILGIADAHVASDAGGRALFDRLIGTWDVRYEFTDRQGNPRNDRGAVEYSWTLGGKALQEVWASESDDQGLRPFGTTIDFYDAQRQSWTAVWMYPSQGMTQIMRGGAANGALVLTGHDDTGALQRWSTHVVEPDSVVIRAEVSKDDGNSWQPAGVSYLHRSSAGGSNQAHPQTRIRSFSDVIVGHSVGGVTIDATGTVYVADFGDLVWRVKQNGEREVLASGLYGSSGNAIDEDGNLLQSSFYGNSVMKIDRTGKKTTLVTSGLSGPVGIAVQRQKREFYVANCTGNSIARVTAEGAVSSFAKSPLFNCPNGAAFDRDGNLYVVNYRDNQMLKIDRQGAVAPFATVSAKGLGHLCFKDDRFYVTASQAHELYEVTLDGVARRILGNGERGMVDGPSATARLSFPNGVACHPWAPRLYLNEALDGALSELPRHAIIREIILEPSG